MLLFPEHSFYKMTEWTDGDPAPDIGDHNRNTPIDPCADEFQICLPVYDLNDVSFQVFSTDNATTTSLAGLYIGVCELDGTPLQHPAPSPSYRWNSFTWVDATDSGSIGIPSTVFAAGIRDTIDVDACFRLYIFNDARTILYISKYCFTIIEDKCFTAHTLYYNNEDALGFKYYYDNAGEETEIGFTNKVRLWYYCGQPQPKDNRKAYRLSTGDYRTTALTKEKINECWTDSMFWDMHEKVDIAFAHDHVSFTNEEDDFGRDVIRDGDYDIEYVDRKEFPRYRVGQATFKVKDSPYANFNHNCKP